MTRQRLQIGKKGEEIARIYLKRQGYKILEKNYKTRNGEIDLIARDGNCLVFIEVKTRTGQQYGTALEAITPRKCRQISRVAVEYMLKNGGMDQVARFDVVAVQPGCLPEVELVRDAFDLAYEC